MDGERLERDGDPEQLVSHLRVASGLRLEADQRRALEIVLRLTFHPRHAEECTRERRRFMSGCFLNRTRKIIDPARARMRLSDSGRTSGEGARTSLLHVDLHDAREIAVARIAGHDETQALARIEGRAIARPGDERAGAAAGRDFG